MITIPDEILNDERLNHTEVLLLSIYHNYTLYGKEHCCLLTNSKLGDMLHISSRQIRTYKQHFKELGLIESNGGIKVWYKGGAENCTHNSSREEVNFPHNSNETEGCSKLPHKEEVNCQGGGSKLPHREEVNFPHNINNLNLEYKDNLNGNLFPQGSCFKPEEVN